MKEHEYDNFVDLMAELSLNFKGNVVNNQIRLYFDRLKKYKLLAVKRGIDYLIDNRKYHDFPVVGCIKEAIENSRVFEG